MNKDEIAESVETKAREITELTEAIKYKADEIKSLKEHVAELQADARVEARVAWYRERMLKIQSLTEKDWDRSVYRLTLEALSEDDAAISQLLCVKCRVSLEPAT